MSIARFVIICAIDRSEYSAAVIANAFDEALKHEGCIIHFITIAEPDEVGKGKRVSDSGLKQIDHELRTLVGEGFSTFSRWLESQNHFLRVHVRTGEPVDEIVELAYETRADKIILGHHGSSGKKRKHGGIPGQVLDRAPCSVTVLRAKDLRTDLGAEQCADCVFMRGDSGGAQWFCPAHQEGRIPRLVGRAGSGDYKSGWGLF